MSRCLPAVKVRRAAQIGGHGHEAWEVPLSDRGALVIDPAHGAAGSCATMRALIAVLGLALAGCASSNGDWDTAVASPPTLIAAGQDMVWMTRSVVVPLGETRRTVSGLFACYRAPDAPGPPTCYLAKYDWDPKNLSWPAPLFMDLDGTVHQYQLGRAPAQTPPEVPRACISTSDCPNGEQCVELKIGGRRCSPPPMTP